MTKSSAGIVIVSIIISACINSNSKKTVNREYQTGFSEGEKAGYIEVETNYIEKFKEQDSFYKQKIADQKSFYEKKIKTAGEDGFSQGQKDKQKEVEDNLYKTTVEKEKKGRWNDVLFDVNN